MIDDNGNDDDCSTDKPEDLAESKPMFVRNHRIYMDDTFTFSPYNSTRGRPYKLFKHHSSGRARSIFFCKRVVNLWNSLGPYMIL